MARSPKTSIIITAKDEASAVFTSLRAHAGKIAAAIGTYFGARMFGDAIGSAMDFEAAMSRVQAASGASGAELTSLQSAAENAGATTKYTATQAAGALENLAKAGLSASQSVQALPAVLNLAQAGGVELGTAAEYITKAVSGMGLAFADAGRVADVLAMGANASNTSVEGLAQALSYAAPLANSLGLSLEQTVAIIGKFADAGIDASRAGTALNSILAQFSDPASKFRQALADAGITTNDFDQALRQLAAAGTAGQKAILAVGQEAGPALRALLNQGIGALDDLKGKLDDAAGSAAQTAGTMGANLTGAMQGLSSAWDALRRALVAPLLQPLAEQLNALATRFRTFVADGTIARFGETIRTAFESGAKWVSEFVAKVDFERVTARMQEFAARTGELFAKIGEHATTAGGVMQTAYGVMATGINTVLAAIYRVGQGMSWLTSAFLADLSRIAAGIDAITPDVISTRFRAAADELRLQAQAAYAVSEEFGRKSTEAFAGAAEGAEIAADGWKTLIGATTEAATAATAAADAVAQAGGQAGLTADQLDALGEGAQFVAGKVTEAGAAAQGAAPKMAEFGRAAEDTAAQVASAFERLGVTSDAALQSAAANARRDFETIRNSGVATTRDIERAFTAYAEKAIAANGGVASETLKAKSAMYGLRIEVDETGKAIVRAMGEAKGDTDDLGQSAADAAEQYRLLGGVIGGLPSPPPPPGSPPPGGGAGQDGGTGDVSWRNADGSLKGDNSGSTFRRLDWGQETTLSRAERLGGLALRKQIEREWSSLRNGQSVPYEEFMKAMSRTIQQLDKLQIQQERASNKFAANEPRTVGPVPQDPPRTETFRVEIGTGAGRLTTINTASRADAEALTRLLQQLEADMSRAS